MLWKRPVEAVVGSLLSRGAGIVKCLSNHFYYIVC